MQDFIGKLYDKIVCIEDDKIELGKKFDDEVEETVAPLLESMSEQEVEVIKELFWSAGKFKLLGTLKSMITIPSKTAVSCLAKSSPATEITTDFSL